MAESDAAMEGEAQAYESNAQDSKGAEQEEAYLAEKDGIVCTATEDSTKEAGTVKEDGLERRVENEEKDLEAKAEKTSFSGDKTARIYETLIETMKKEGFDEERLKEMGYSELLKFAGGYAKEKYGVKETFFEPKEPGWLDRKIANLPGSIRWIGYAVKELGENIEKEENLALGILRTKGRVVIEDKGSLGVGIDNKYLGINTTKMYDQSKKEIDGALLLVNEHRNGADLINYSRWHTDPSSFSSVFSIAGRDMPGITRSYIGDSDRVMTIVAPIIEGGVYPPKNATVIKNAGHWDMAKNPDVLAAVGRDIKDFYLYN